METKKNYKQICEELAKLQEKKDLFDRLHDVGGISYKQVDNTQKKQKNISRKSQKIVGAFLLFNILKMVYLSRYGSMEHLQAKHLV